MMRIERVGETIDLLGEGPLWDVAEQALYWVDSRGPTIHRLDWATGERCDWDVPEGHGGARHAAHGRRQGPRSAGRCAAAPFETARSFNWNPDRTS